MSSTFFAENLNASGASTLTGDATLGSNLVFDRATNDLTVTVADQTTAASSLNIPSLTSTPQDVVCTVQAQTIENKSIANSSILSNTEVVDAVDTTKQVAFDVSGAAGSTSSTLTFAQQSNQVVTFPDGTGTVAFQPAAGSDNQLVRIDTSGSFPTIQNSTVTLGDAGALAGVASVAAPTASDITLTTDAGQIVSIPGDTVIGGDLTVQGTTTSIDSVNVKIADNNVFLSSNYTTNLAREGGITVNYLPTATTSAVAGTAFASATTVEVADGTGFTTAGDIILVTDANDPNNNGIFQIASAAANVITINSSPAFNFLQTGFTTDATVAGSVTIITVAVLQAGTDGRFEVAQGSSATSMTFTDIALISDIPAGGWIQSDTTGTSATFAIPISTLPDGDSGTLEVVYTGRDTAGTGTIGGKLTRVFQRDTNVSPVGAGSKDESTLGTGADWVVTAATGAITTNIDINVTQSGAATFDWRVIYRLTVNPVV